MKPIVEVIFREAQRWGVRLQKRGENIIITPKGKAPPEYLDLIRQNKSAVISWFEAMEARLPKDHAPWLHVAKQVLAGEFDACSNSMRESLVIGLRSINHATCRQAMERLKEAA
jgi:hypothetical protein